MTSQLASRLVRGFASAAIAVGMIAVSAPVQPVQAQGLLGAIFGALSGNYRPQQSRNYAPSYEDRYPGYERPDHHPQAEVRGSGTNCVRLCDGRHFPIPRSANGHALDSAKVCSALCPAAKTAVYFGSNLAYATTSDGKRYSDLDSAFVYRDRIVQDCSCTGRGPGGLAQINIESDPTLRAGDIVATAEGLAVFNGGRSFPYRTADFTPVGDYGRVNADLRKRLSAIKVDPTATPATPVQTLATADEKPAAKPQQQPRRKRALQAARDDERYGRPTSGWFDR